MHVHITVLESDDKKNLENSGGLSLMESLKGKEAGLPFFAFVDANGKPIINSLQKKEPGDEGQNIGHPMEPHEIFWFLRMVREAAPKITEEEVLVLNTWLKNQKR